MNNQEQENKKSEEQLQSSKAHSNQDHENKVNVSMDKSKDESDSTNKNVSKSASKNISDKDQKSETHARSGKEDGNDHRFSSGVTLGIFAGFIFTITLALLVLGFFYNAGYLHFGNGEIYVQDSHTSDDDGIGSKVESKLNTLDSILSNGFYFSDVDEDTAADSIYKAYLDSYDDKYTVYYTSDEYKKMTESITGTFYGIGAVCQKNKEDGSILLPTVYEDGAAYKAGIRSGDCITKIDGQDVTDLEVSEAVALIKGKKGTAVWLEVKRKDELFTVKATRAEVTEQTVSSKLMDNNVGYIQISQFDTVTTKQFQSAYKDLQDQGMKSLVVDLRYNPGGSLKTVVDILDELLPNGTIVYTEEKSGKKTENKGSNSDEINIPMAVLVNGYSASASEIFAGAVQDYEKGRIIGTQTFGKGIVQTTKPLSDGSAIKYTMAKYYTPKGQDIQGKGVTPDQVVDLPDDSTEDLQLNAAKQYLKTEMDKQ